MVPLEQWRCGRTLFAHLRARGVATPIATLIASRSRRDWWVSHQRYVFVALPDKPFDAMGGRCPTRAGPPLLLPMRSRARVRRTRTHPASVPPSQGEPDATRAPGARPRRSAPRRRRTTIPRAPHAGGRGPDGAFRVPPVAALRQRAPWDEHRAPPMGRRNRRMFPENARRWRARWSRQLGGTRGRGRHATNLRLAPTSFTKTRGGARWALRPRGLSASG